MKNNEKSIIKKTGEYIAFFIIIIGGIYLPRAFEDKCNKQYIEKSVQKTIKKIEKKKHKPEVQKLINNLYERFQRDNMNPRDFDKHIKVIFQYILMLKNNCTISEDLNNEFYFATTGITIEKGTHNCPIGQYADKAKETIKYLRNSGHFETVKEGIYKNIISGVNREHFTNSFNVKWKDLNFQNRIIMMVLQTSYRTENKCNNPNAVFNAMIKEISNI